MAIRHGCPPLRIKSDCQTFADGYHKGEAWGLGAEAAYAETWKEFWEAVRDLGPEQQDIDWIPSHTTQAAV